MADEGKATHLQDDFVERVARNAVAVVVSGTALAFVTAAWFAPYVASYMSLRKPESQWPHVGSLAILTLCVGVAWWLTPEPSADESPHPLLTKVSKVVRNGGLAGFVLAVLACWSAQVGYGPVR